MVMLRALGLWLTLLTVAQAGVTGLDVTTSDGVIHLLLAEGGEHPALRHVSSSDGGQTWTVPVRVDGGQKPPFEPHRGMEPQIAAHGRRLVAVWTTAGTDKWGSGPLATAISTDGGQSWRAGPNPADDGLTTGHGFSDIVTDARGVFHLVWLDSRTGRQGLRYARSRTGGRTWSANRTLVDGTCECCWNTLAVESPARVWALYRGRSPRDMAVVGVADNVVNRVAPFDWEFDGCPHVGGGLGVGSEGRLQAVIWTGREGEAGVYHVASRDRGRTWQNPQRLGGATARRADLAVDGDLCVAVWEERGAIWGAESVDGGRLWSAPRELSCRDFPAQYPRVVVARDRFHVFWTEAAEGQPARWASARW